ncbi:MAG: MarC family protein [Thermoleophilia bacterium]|nr:MarC family protein [Thermoleophilia bacterium]
MTADLNYFIQAIVGVFIITDPITRGFFFKTLTENEPDRRREWVRKITLAVAIILGISALAGREILEIIGINLGAFGVAGGIVVTMMGFEMLFGGEPSRAQGGKAAHEEPEPEPESFEGSVIVPYAMPFVAGPGAITLVISISAGTSDFSGAIAALVAVAVAVILLPIGHLLISEKLNISENGMKIATKFGGLLIATIGIQLMLSGIQTYFKI